MSVLTEIQVKLKAPKGQYNDYSSYNYRNAEDIEAALKPLLAEWDATLFITDEMVELAGRVYVKATVTLTAGEKWVVNAFAREAEKETGKSPSQVTGSASSYARKYALSGMFLIDNTKDSDSEDNRDKPKAKPDPDILKAEEYMLSFKDAKTGEDLKAIYLKAYNIVKSQAGKKMLSAAKDEAKTRLKL